MIEILDLSGGVNVSKVSCGSRHAAAVTCKFACDSLTCLLYKFFSASLFCTAAFSNNRKLLLKIVIEILDLPGGVNVSKVSYGSRHTAAVTCKSAYCDSITSFTCIYKFFWFTLFVQLHFPIMGSTLKKIIEKLDLPGEVNVSKVSCGSRHTGTQCNKVLMLNVEEKH